MIEAFASWSGCFPEGLQRQKKKGLMQRLLTGQVGA